MRNAASKLMWIGRGASMVFGLALVLALVMGVSTTAMASIPGDPFRLGAPNAIDAISSLVGDVTGPMLRVTNNDEGAGATALELRVQPGKAPMKVNSATKVANLNADKLDGKDSTEFLGKSEKAADATHADSADHATSADSAANATSAGDANTLDGKDSTDFVAGTGIVTPVDESFSDPDGTGGGDGYSSVLTVPGAKIRAACVQQSSGIALLLDLASGVDKVRLWRDDGATNPTAKTLFIGTRDPMAETDWLPVTAADHVIWQGSSAEGTFTAELFTRYESGGTCHLSGYVLSN